MSTTADAIKITTKDPYIISTINERFSVNNMDGYAVTPYNENNKNESFPTMRNPVIKKY
jgi:hypothetical protein